MRLARSFGAAAELLLAPASVPALVAGELVALDGPVPFAVVAAVVAAATVTVVVAVPAALGAGAGCIPAGAGAGADAAGARAASLLMVTVVCPPFWSTIVDVLPSSIRVTVSPAT